MMRNQLNQIEAVKGTLTEKKLIRLRKQKRPKDQKKQRVKEANPLAKKLSTNSNRVSPLNTRAFTTKKKTS